jgi:hypothetical protein
VWNLAWRADTGLSVGTLNLLKVWRQMGGELILAGRTRDSRRQEDESEAILTLHFVPRLAAQERWGASSIYEEVESPMRHCAILLMGNFSPKCKGRFLGAKITIWRHPSLSPSLSPLESCSCMQSRRGFG